MSSFLVDSDLKYQLLDQIFADTFRLCRSEYLALFASLSLVFLEGIIRIITSCLRTWRVTGTLGFAAGETNGQQLLR